VLWNLFLIFFLQILCSKLGLQTSCGGNSIHVTKVGSNNRASDDRAIFLWQVSNCGLSSNNTVVAFPTKVPDFFPPFFI
jgi:hypothetical protein